MAKRILQIDGGGVMGLAPAIVLAELERRLLQKYNKRLYQVFDLIAGTSTGAIQGGAIAAGVPAETIAEMYEKKAPELFKARSQWNPGNWLAAKYDRGPFIEEMERTLDFTGQALAGRRLGDVRTRYLATAFNLCSTRTHFLKSWKQKDRNHSLIDVIAWSALSAAHFFGKIVSPDYQWDYYGPDGDPRERIAGAVWQDGGQGYHNSTAAHVLHEVFAHRWAEREKVFILSLGCGEQSRFVSPEQAAEFGYVREIKEYLKNQARRESIIGNVLAGEYVAAKVPNLTFHRMSFDVPADRGGLDDLEYLPDLRLHGEALAKRIDDRLLKTLAG